MAFSFDDSLGDAVSRVRSDLGDIVTPGLLPDATYQAVLDRHTTGDPAVTDEAAATRDLARKLAVRYAIEPTSLNTKGSSLSWGERVAQWNRIALGDAGGAAASRGKGITLRRGPARDYTTGDGDASN